MSLTRPMTTPHLSKPTETTTTIIKQIIPRRSKCTEATTYFMTFAAKLQDYFVGTLTIPKENEDDIGQYDSFTREECFYSNKAAESTAFSQEIFKATDIAKTKKRHKCRINLGSINDEIKSDNLKKNKVTRKNSILLYHPDDLEELFTLHADKLETKESVNTFGHHFNKDRTPVIMALTSDDPRYPKVRQQFTSTVFGKEALSTLFPTLQKIASNLTEQLQKSDHVNIKDYGKSFALRTILEGILKTSVIDELTIKTLSAYIDEGVDQAVKLPSLARISLEAFKLIIWKMKSHADDHMSAAINLVLNDVIKKNENAIRSDPSGWLPKFVDLENEFIAAQQRNSEIAFQKTHWSNIVNKLYYLASSHVPSYKSAPDIVSTDSAKETAFIITAGSDTTSNNITQTITSILQDEKLSNELTEEIFSLKKSPQEMTLDDFRNLPLTKKIVLESLRLNPPLPIQKALVKADFTMHDGTFIKAGTHIYINVREANRTPYTSKIATAKPADDAKSSNFLRNPEKFNPHRFDEFATRQELNQFLDTSKFKYRYNFQSFGKGQRMCPGRELAILETTMAIVYSFYYFKLKLLNETIRSVVTFGSRPVGFDAKNPYVEKPIVAGIELRKPKV